MQWPWPSGVVYAETIVTTGQHPGPLDPGPWEIDIRPCIQKSPRWTIAQVITLAGQLGCKLQATSLKLDSYSIG